MEGKVLDFDANKGSGVILCNSRIRYSFEASDWLSKEPPEKGLFVDFISKDGRAEQIYVDLPKISQDTLAETKSEITPATIVYILYLSSIVVGITSIVGVILAYIHKAKSNALLKSHYSYQIRTFWNVFFGAIFSLCLIIENVGAVYIFLGILYTWFLYRIVRGWINLSREVPMQ